MEEKTKSGSLLTESWGWAQPPPPFTAGPTLNYFYLTSPLTGSVLSGHYLRPDGVREVALDGEAEQVAVHQIARLTQILSE